MERYKKIFKETAPSASQQELIKYVNSKYKGFIRSISFEYNIMTMRLNKVDGSRGEIVRISGKDTMTGQNMKLQAIENKKMAEKIIKDISRKFSFEDIWNDGSQNEIIGGIID